jgi:hypothetical protein
MEKIEEALPAGVVSSRCSRTGATGGADRGIVRLSEDPDVHTDAEQE